MATLNGWTFDLEERRKVLDQTLKEEGRKQKDRGREREGGENRKRKEKLGWSKRKKWFGLKISSGMESNFVEQKNDDWIP